MFRPAGLLEWEDELSIRFPFLAPSLVWGLALWSYGMIVARSCGLTSVAALMGALLGRSANTVRQQLREWCYDAEDKRGQNRTEVAVERCFGPLVRWILEWWQDESQRLALALDASTLGTRFTILMVSVVYRGCAIPVAWMVLPANTPGQWRPHWLALLSQLGRSIPTTWEVIVLADRGLYARWLFEAIRSQGWHPFLRINQQGYVAPRGEGFRPLASVLAEPGGFWAGAVTCFSTPDRRLLCTLVACWDAPHAEPWLIVTDLPPDSAAAGWYAMRAWIEALFKHAKRGGWHWEQTKMTDPARAQRLWLAISVATLWVISRGTPDHHDLLATSLTDHPDLLPALRPTRRSRPRLLSSFRAGLLLLLADIIKGAVLIHGRFVPEPWLPVPFHPLSTYP